MNAFLKNTRPAPAKVAILVLVGVVGVGGSMAMLLLGRGQWPTYVGAVAMAFAAAAFASTARRLYGGEPVRPAMRGFLIGFLGAMTAYVVLLLGAVQLYMAGLTQGALGYAAALAPVIALVAAFASLGLYVLRETDELLRRITVESLLWALGATLSLATAWGVLEAFGKAPHLQLWVVAPVFAVVFGLAQGLVSWRYR
ncbi:hypothetical protein G5B46_20705 [Caulobacter sp. 602-2]|uniref:Uncharacterized protein n=1 Tax=Caulobacter sp. 602-2 TaxID=2710887 RepID=A0A6G4R2V3_9CAUL|nr:hypothetical protein [Caulobacter sp. 602-2]NGM52039.1 hypothetical protein [Caulobacter sp. 602-2]